MPTLVTAQQLAAELDSSAPPTVLDVREPEEVASCAIDGSLRVPLAAVLAAPPDLPRDADLVVHCKVQPRADAAAEALEAAGFTRVRVLQGGILAWLARPDASGRP